MNNDFPIAYFNEAVALREQWQVAEARVMLQRLHKRFPKHTDTMFQLAIAERFLQHWPKAIALLRQSIQLAPDRMDYHDQLAQVLMFSNQGANNLLAIETYASVLNGMPTHHVAATNLLVLALRNDQPEAILRHVAPMLERTLRDEQRLHMAAACAIASFVAGDFSACDGHTATALALEKYAFEADGSPKLNDLFFMFSYAEFLALLAEARTQQPDAYALPTTPSQLLHIIGESHCLTPAHRIFRHGDGLARCVPHLLMGMKAYFFAIPEHNAVKETLQLLFKRLPKQEDVVVCFGELDCRPKEGLLVQHRRQPDYDMGAAINTLCAGYVKYVKLSQLKRIGRTYIFGVPAPNRTVADQLEAGEEALFIGMIARFNAALAREACRQELGFIDIYTATLGNDGWARAGVHLDKVHLRPEVTAEAMTRALALQVDSNILQSKK